MSNPSTPVRASFPLMPIALLITIGLLVANGAGWIHIAWWLCWLPLIIAVGFAVAILVIALGILAVGYAALRNADKKRARPR